MIYTRMIGDKEEDDKEAEGGVVVCYPDFNVSFKTLKSVKTRKPFHLLVAVSCSIIPI